MTKFKTPPLLYGDKFLELRQITEASRADERPIDGNVNSPYHALKVLWKAVVDSLTVTSKGQVTLKRDLLQHLGVEPGERIDVQKLPNGELRIRAMQPTGSIDDFLGMLAGKTRKIATIEEINEAAAAGWAGKK
ncbi:SpoVT-AbrB domain containing protein [Oxalobacteraceae bacterium]